MLTWIYLVLLLYLAQIYISGSFVTVKEGLVRHFGPRDEIPPRGVIGARAERALTNLKENLPFFFVPAILSFVASDVDHELAVLGAQLFFFARLCFLLLYVAGTPWLRSLAYGVGLVGNAMMLFAVWP